MIGGLIIGFIVGCVVGGFLVAQAFSIFYEGNES